MSWNRLILIIIILLGLVLRLFVLFQRGSFWFDEAFSVHFAAMDLPQMWHYLRFENNPPGYFILLHFWMKLFGSSELAARSLSMIFGIGAIPLIYLLGKRLYSSAAGLFASFLLAVSTLTVVYSTETRMYAMYLFLALLMMILFLKAQRHQSPIVFCFLLVVFVLLVWTHITAWFIILALAMFLFWQSQFHIKKFIIHNSKFIILGALLALQFLPWAVNFIQLKIVAPIAQGQFFYIPPDRNFFLSILESFLVFGQNNAFVVAILSVVIGMLLWRALSRRTVLDEQGLSSARLLFCWLSVPLLIGFAFSNAVPRYYIAAAPALYLLMGIGFARYSKDCPSQLQRTVLAVPAVLFALILTAYPPLIQIANHQWNNLAQWVEHESAPCSMPHTPCLILVHSHSEILAFEKYYHGRLPVVGFYPREDADDRDSRIVKTNWKSVVTKQNIRDLADVTDEFEQVFLVLGEIDQTSARELIPQWFWENGWKRAEAKKFGQIEVVALEKR